MAEELGIHYEHKPIGPRTGETQTEYQQLNRKQKIPFMQDGDVKLSESLAIAATFEISILRAGTHPTGSRYQGQRRRMVLLHLR